MIIFKKYLKKKNKIILICEKLEHLIIDYKTYEEQEKEQVEQLISNTELYNQWKKERMQGGIFIGFSGNKNPPLNSEKLMPKDEDFKFCTEKKEIPEATYDEGIEVNPVDKHWWIQMSMFLPKKIDGKVYPIYKNVQALLDSGASYSSLNNFPLILDLVKKGFIEEWNYKYTTYDPSKPPEIGNSKVDFDKIELLIFPAILTFMYDGNSYSSYSFVMAARSKGPDRPPTLGQNDFISKGIWTLIGSNFNSDQIPQEFSAFKPGELNLHYWRTMDRNIIPITKIFH